MPSLRLIVFVASHLCLASLAHASEEAVRLPDGSGILLRLDSGELKVRVYSPTVIRASFSPDAKWPDDSSLAVIAKPVSSGWSFSTSGDEIHFKTSVLDVRVNRQNGALVYYDLQGNRIAAERPGTREFKPCILSGVTSQAVAQQFELASDEAIFGLGQHQDGLMNQRGHSVLLEQKNTRIALPVMLSSRGYGILWDNPSVATVDVGTKTNEDTVRWTSEVGDMVDYCFLYGPKPDSVVAGYRGLTGQAPLFGRWAYGYWQCKNRYASQAELLGVLSEYRQRHIPIDNIVLDWFYWNKGTWGSHEFNLKAFPDAEEMVRKVHEMNAHIMISVWGRFEPGTKNYQEMEQAGDFFGVLFPNYAGDFKYYDAFNPKARALYWEQIRRSLYVKGFDAWWQDATEPEVPDFRKAPTSMGPGAHVFNAFPLKATQANYEGQRKESSDKRVFILTRSAYAGQQRNAAASWSGDIGSDWETFKNQIPAGLNFVACGIPYWTTDIGGFRGRPTDDPDYRELFVRWFQYGAFCPIFRVHGSRGEKSLWSYGPEAESVLIKYDQLRYRLLPYIYSVAHRVTADNYTMMRPLVMDFRADKKALPIADQFMFGPAFMVAPVTEPRAGAKTVVPAGNLADVTGQVGGLSGTYFQGENFESPKLKRRDPFLAFKWNTKSQNLAAVGEDFQTDPIPGMAMTNFSARWEGFLVTKDAGDYQLSLKADDGMRLWVDGKLLIEKWTPGAAIEKTLSTKLPANSQVPIKIEYFQDKSGASIELRWQPPVNADGLGFTRKVYLPAGIWHDFWTGKSIEGGQTVAAAAPLDTMPLYIKAGSIIPLGPVMQYSTERPADPIELRVYRGADGEFTFYEDENDSYDYEKGIFATIPMRWDEKDQTLTIGARQGKFPGMLTTRRFRIAFVNEKHGTGLAETADLDAEVIYDGHAQKVKASKYSFTEHGN